MRTKRIAILSFLVLLAVMAFGLVHRFLDKEAMPDAHRQVIDVPALKIVRHDTDALAPFLWLGKIDLTLTQEGLLNVAAKRDPLRPFTLAFRLLREYDRNRKAEYKQAAKRALDFMLDSYEPAVRSPEGIRWFYGFPYEGIPTNWWSGMDRLFGPLTLYAGWEEFGDPRYREEAIRSAKLALRSPSEGGVLWREGKNCWISEYTWSNMKSSDEYHVLNGHLWGLQALYLLAAATQDAELVEAYHCAARGTFARQAEFEQPKTGWTRYQLNPQVINPTHYLLLEMSQFRAMYLLTGDSRWREGADLRAKIFRQHYPIQVFDNNRRGVRAIFSMVGPPHPYWTDTYPVSIECVSSGQIYRVKQVEHYSKRPYEERFFAELVLPSRPDKCDVFIHPIEKERIYVYTQEQFGTDGLPSGSTSFTATASYALTESVGGVGEFTVIPKEGVSDGRLTIDFQKKIADSDLIGIVVKPDKDMQLGVLLNDRSGKSHWRDYNDLKGERSNIVLLSTAGFNIRGTAYPDPISVTLRFYTNRASKVKLESATLLRNHDELQRFFRSNTNAFFHQQ